MPPNFVEVLESRIAPAVILAGPTAQGGQDYDDAGTPFQAATGLDALTAGDPSLNFDASHFYIDLKSGDTLRVYNSGSAFSDFITVTGGRAYAVFFDKNGDFTPTVDELTGLVLSENAKLSVNGTVDGDILATLNSKTGIFSTDDLVSNKQTIAGLTIKGDVNGGIIAGGSISNVSVGKVGTIQAGTNGAAYAFNFGGTGAAPGVGVGTIADFDPGMKLAGGSLTNISAGSAIGLYAGKGGAGAAGGSITGVTVVADADGMEIFGGAGGDGIVALTAGGAGGKVSKVVFGGVADASANSLIHVQGGDGGDAFAGSTGKSGVGGAVDNIWVGYKYDASKKIIESPDILKDEVFVAGGNGGDGVSAGSGGNASTINIISAVDEDGGAAEITIMGGDAGAFDLIAVGKKAGAGGSVSNFKIKNMDLDAGGGISDVLVQGGDASNAAGAPVAGSAAAGGSITNPAPKVGEAWLIGQSFTFIAGDGSSTVKGGGAGGSISNLQFSSLPNIYLEDLSVDAGAGGDSTTGAGGAGGDVSGIFVPLSELNSFIVASGAGGESQGAGGKGKAGGRGGNINNVQVFDVDAASIVNVAGTAGAGGKGFAGGGAGGSINSFSFFAQYASLALTGGSGGDVNAGSIKGNGGAGGSLTGVAFKSDTAGVGGQTVNLDAGSGGDGPKASGAGGSITKANVQTTSFVIMHAGTAGDSMADKGKIGAGGSIGSSNATLGVFAKSLEDSVTFMAGDAGGYALISTPGAGAAGGSILNAVASASDDISFIAGDGSLGGNGGDIVKIGFYGEEGVSDIPGGDIAVIAGNGGNAIDASKAAGRGGNVTTAVGHSSANAAASVQFAAGTGGSLGKTGGAGGSFNGLTIYGGSADFAVVAGHAGDGVGAGGVGGSVSNVAVADSGIVVRAIAAGDGGDASDPLKGKGGLGGSVSNVNIAGDIGIRTGANYGFATDGTLMGGVFAGTGGVGTAVNGLAGNVTSITAQAISAIVAGRGVTPQLVNIVDKIYLGGNTPATVNGVNAFTNFATANLVGGKAGNPALANADDFHFVGDPNFSPSDTTSSPWTLGTTTPLDGLIAAITLTANRNFTPLAFLTTDGAGHSLYVPTVAVA
jgi:hypothetical protein